MILREQLEELKNSDYYPFHMPGHKRKQIAKSSFLSFAHDITEIDDFDNLHDAQGILLKEQAYAAKVFGAEETFFLVNGSSCGLLASIYTVCKKNSPKLLVARNSHKSVYHGIYLTDANAKYLLPETVEGYSFSGEILANQIDRELSIDVYDAVIITSPTYEGVLSNIGKIVDIAHKYNVPVIVDEAHGAYLGIFGDGNYFPQSAIKFGADLVIQSTHKTLPALTQTAILHVQGSMIDRERLRQNLSIFQTSSPSYLFMENISDCIHFCDENKERLSSQYKQLLTDFYKAGKSLKNIEIVDGEQLGIIKDPGKLVIKSKNCDCYTGKNLYDDLRNIYHLQMEMAAFDYVIAMTSIMDEKDDFNRLLSALVDIDKKIETFAKKKDSQMKTATNTEFHFIEALKMKDAIDCSDSKKILLDQSAGEVSKDFVYLYPPGIPVIVPGEQITEEIIDYIKAQLKVGLVVNGLEIMESDYYIRCVS